MLISTDAVKDETGAGGIIIIETRYLLCYPQTNLTGVAWRCYLTINIRWFNLNEAEEKSFHWRSTCWWLSEWEMNKTTKKKLSAVESSI